MATVRTARTIEPDAANARRYDACLTPQYRELYRALKTVRETGMSSVGPASSSSRGRKWKTGQRHQPPMHHHRSRSYAGHEAWVHLDARERAWWGDDWRPRWRDHDPQGVNSIGVVTGIEMTPWMGVRVRSCGPRPAAW